MKESWQRTAILVGEDGVTKLENARVVIFGVGGVGGFVAEALARAGVGTIGLVDKDVISESNLNRQIIALRSTVGETKTSVMKKRIRDINPACDVREYPIFYLPENANDFPLSEYTYIVDAVDTVTAKVEIAVRAKAAAIPMISVMGCGNKLDPEAFTVADLAKTDTCPLARVMRRELKARGITHLKVVYSKEPPVALKQKRTDTESGKSVPGSISYAPATAGLLAASAVIRDILGEEPNQVRLL